MNNTVRDAITATPLGNGIGAQVDGVNLREPITTEMKEQIMAAWMRHLVLRFRGQQGMSTHSSSISNSWFERIITVSERSQPTAYRERTS